MQQCGLYKKVVFLHHVYEEIPIQYMTSVELDSAFSAATISNNKR